MTEPRRLRGHKATATCCIAAVDRPGLVATSGEDGCVCWFDMRCKDAISVMNIGDNDNPISSLCFKPGNEDIIYVSLGSEVKGFDVHMAASWKPLESYKYNKEEINQIVCSSKSTFLAAADDGGDVKIIDLRQQSLYKTLRGGHDSVGVDDVSQKRFVAVYSSFLGDPGKRVKARRDRFIHIVNANGAVITGGLDSKLVMWDFSKGRPNKILDFGAEASSNGGQFLNPAFVHAVAVPEVDMLDRTDRICVVGRGDGIVDVINIESELAETKSRSKGTQSRSKARILSPDSETSTQNGTKKLHLDYSFGGHTAAVSCVAFSKFGEKGKYIISGGNDKSVKAWDWSRHFESGETSSNSNLLHLNINLSKKVNWLCTTTNDSENLVVCDTSKVVKVYTVM